MSAGRLWNWYGLFPASAQVKIPERLPRPPGDYRRRADVFRVDPDPRLNPARIRQDVTRRMFPYWKKRPYRRRHAGENVRVDSDNVPRPENDAITHE